MMHIIVLMVSSVSCTDGNKDTGVTADVQKDEAVLQDEQQNKTVPQDGLEGNKNQQDNTQNESHNQQDNTATQDEKQDQQDKTVTQKNDQDQQDGTQSNTETKGEKQDHQDSTDPKTVTQKNDQSQQDGTQSNTKSKSEQQDHQDNTNLKTKSQKNDQSQQGGTQSSTKSKGEKQNPQTNSPNTTEQSDKNCNSGSITPTDDDKTIEIKGSDLRVHNTKTKVVYKLPKGFKALVTDLKLVPVDENNAAMKDITVAQPGVKSVPSSPIVNNTNTESTEEKGAYDSLVSWCKENWVAILISAIIAVVITIGAIMLININTRSNKDLNAI